MEQPTKIRNAVKAIIIRDGKILLTKNRDAEGDFYLLPGGGQEPGETMIDALTRECREEINCEVYAGELRFVREYLGANHQFAGKDDGIHQIEYMFDCAIDVDAQPQNGSQPDDMQTGLCWVPLDELQKVTFYPSAIVRPLQRGGRGEHIYLGDVN